jgi:transcriptional regulator with XRE-family HTH domain
MVGVGARANQGLSTPGCPLRLHASCARIVGMRASRSAELGVFLRMRRERLSPEDAGLSAAGRRRVPGLRREEVAGLAGVSVDYYTELEQGAGAQPTEQVLTVLARTLQLSGDERSYLYRLAGRPLPVAPVRPAAGRADVDPGMLDLVGRLGDTPAQFITDLHVTLAQNAAAVDLVGDETRHRGLSASFIHRWFADPASRAVYPVEDHAAQSRSFAADLRAAAAARGAGGGQDAEVAALVTDLLGVSGEFRELWARHQVAVRRNNRKRIVRPGGLVTDVVCRTLPSEDGRQRLLWFTPGRPSDQL